MRLTFDTAKRAKTLAERGLDFADAALVFEGNTLELEYDRKDYGETRIICFGLLAERWWWSATPRVARIATSSA